VPPVKNFTPPKNSLAASYVTLHGRRLFESVTVTLGQDLSPWSSGERRGNFVVRSSEAVAGLRGELIEIAESAGAVFTAEVLGVVEKVVYFRLPRRSRSGVRPDVGAPAKASPEQRCEKLWEPV